MADPFPMLTQFLWREFALADLFESLEAPGAMLLQGLHGPSRALALAACQVGTGRTLLVLCRSEEVATALATDLEFFLGSGVAWLPEREADPEARAARVLTLHRLLTGQATVVVASVAAALPRTIAPIVLGAAVLSLYPQRIIPRDELQSVLTAGGYRPVGQVTEPGEYVVRGGIVDCSPPQLPHPVRIEFFGDQVDSLRQFDAETQRSLGPLPQATILPLAETPMTQEAVSRAAARLRSAARRNNVSVPAAILEALDQRG